MLDPLPQALTLFDAVLRGMLLAVLLLLAALLWRDRPGVAAARVGVAMCLGLCVQVVASVPLVEAGVPCLWQAPLVGVSVANATLFWLFVKALFDDDFAFRGWHAGVWFAVAGLAGLNCAAHGGDIAALVPLAPITRVAQRGVPLLFAILAMVAAAAQWRADLVEGRRRLRVFIVVTGVIYTLVMLAARLASSTGRLSTTTAEIDVVLLLFMLGVVAWQMLQLGPTDLFPAARPNAPSAAAHRPGAVDAAAAPQVPVEATPPDPAEERLGLSLQRLMSVERAYRDEDLSVASLATRLAVPEYRLRRLINQRLGHRNFNAYVNGLRLEEAFDALADPQRRELPVLTIALDAGFQSIGPFNRAFKAATGVTPTEFRREKLADS